MAHTLIGTKIGTPSCESVVAGDRRHCVTDSRLELSGVVRVDEVTGQSDSVNRD